MKKTTISVAFDEEKLSAVKLYMEQKGLSFETEMERAADALYGKYVPANVREFIEMRSGEPADPAPRVRRPRPEKKVQPPNVHGTMNESKGDMAHE